MTKRLKLFSKEEPKRMKLFSSPQPVRHKLFSSDDNVEYNDPEGQILRTVICKDCGHTMTTAETVTHMTCPNCGGKRFDLALFRTAEEEVKDPDVEFDRIKEAEEQIKPADEKRYSLFENFLTSYEEKLKEYSGKVLEEDEFEKIFSNEAEDMIEKRFADLNEEGKVEINPFAFETERAFSKLIISVTKTLELDPAIMKGEVEKEEIIDKLEDKLPEKEIMILKKAHDIPTEHVYSEPEENTWLQDSCIIQDLETEYNNESFPIEQFIKILRERYPDAPENIMDLLSEVGVMRIEGARVTIQSNSKK